MKTIANLKGAEFLKATYNIIEEAEKFNDVTGVMAIWKRKPTFTGEETEEEKLAIMREQVVQNWRDMLKSALKINAEATNSFIMCMFVLEDGEAEPEGIDVLWKAFDLIADERLIDFFSKLLKSGVLNIGD